jgi:hypothetical protein
MALAIVGVAVVSFAQSTDDPGDAPVGIATSAGVGSSALSSSTEMEG